MTDSKNFKRNSVLDPKIPDIVTPRPIHKIAEELSLDESAVEPYGWFVGKLAHDLQHRIAERPTGRYIGVTAVSPTPFGEGKLLSQ